MNIEEYIEEDEEPPLLLSSCPSHGKSVHVRLCSYVFMQKRTNKTFKAVGVVLFAPNIQFGYL